MFPAREVKPMSLSFPSFAAALHSGGPAAYHVDQLGLYGQFIGNWTMDGTVYLADGATLTGTGEIHFGWVLQGRAIQDVWIFPGAFFGSTLRVYDPGLDAWHILWSDPVKNYFTRQIGRARGQDIEQNGTNEQGEPIRWSFTDITRNSFHWIGERAPPGSTEYQLQAEFFAKRV
jgi:hypothetical protein